MSGKQLLFVVVATCITIVAWVIFDIIHTRSQVEIPTEQQELIEEVNPNFDTQYVNTF